LSRGSWRGRSGADRAAGARRPQLKNMTGASSSGGPRSILRSRWCRRRRGEHRARRRRTGWPLATRRRRRGHCRTRARWNQTMGSTMGKEMAGLYPRGQRGRYLSRRRHCSDTRRPGPAATTTSAHCRHGDRADREKNRGKQRRCGLGLGRGEGEMGFAQGRQISFCSFF